jgi:hypothetical protein
MVGHSEERKHTLIAVIITLEQSRIQSCRYNLEQRQKLLSEGSVFSFVHELKVQNCTV